MAQPEVNAFVLERLAAHWTRCPVITMNTLGEAPQDGSEFLLVQYPASTNGILDVTARQYREEGGVRFVLHMPRGEGVERPLQWGRELGDLFRSVRSDAVKTGAPSSPYFDDSNDEGAYFIVTVVVPYVLDFEHDGA